jgi:hypothetical protein
VVASLELEVRRELGRAERLGLVRELELAQETAQVLEEQLGRAVSQPGQGQALVLELELASR